MHTVKSCMIIPHKTPLTEELAHYLTERASFHCKSRSPRGLLAFSGIHCDICSKGVSPTLPRVKSHVTSALELNHSKSGDNMNVAHYGMRALFPLWQKLSLREETVMLMSSA